MIAYEKVVRIIILRCRGASYRVIREQTGVSRGVISLLVTGKRKLWRDGNGKWKQAGIPESGNSLQRCPHCAELLRVSQNGHLKRLLRNSKRGIHKRIEKGIIRV
jgi:hypothetical protein